MILLSVITRASVAVYMYHINLISDKHLLPSLDKLDEEKKIIFHLSGISSINACIIYQTDIYIIYRIFPWVPIHAALTPLPLY